MQHAREKLRSHIMCEYFEGGDHFSYLCGDALITLKLVLNKWNVSGLNLPI